MLEMWGLSSYHVLGKGRQGKQRERVRERESRLGFFVFDLKNYMKSQMIHLKQIIQLI